MAQITAIPQPILLPRQLDLPSLLSAGLSVISSILTDAAGNPTSTSIRTTANPEPTTTSATRTPDSTVTSASANSQTRSRTTQTPTRASTISVITSQTSPLSLSSTSSTRTATAATASSSPKAASRSHNNTLAIVLGVVLGIICLLLLALFICLCLRRRRKHGSFLRKNRASSSIGSDGESFIEAGSNRPPPVATLFKETSATSSETMTSFLHNGSATALKTADEISQHHEQAPLYPTVPPAHQMSSPGRRYGEYAYLPSDPFEDGYRAQMNLNRDPMRERERRSRLSLTLDPVREQPMRERAMEETFYRPARRWTAHPGGYGVPTGPPRRIPRKPVPSLDMGLPQHQNGFPERRGDTGGGVDNSNFEAGFETMNRSRYPRLGPRPWNTNQRYYTGSRESF